MENAASFISTDPDPEGSRGVDQEDKPAPIGVGQLYLDLYNPPALASTTDVYMQTYAVVRAILKGESPVHAPTATQAAEDAAAQHVEQSLATGGGQER